jgi:hypothetical protein
MILRFVNERQIYTQSFLNAELTFQYLVIMTRKQYLPDIWAEIMDNFKWKMKNEKLHYLFCYPLGGFTTM